MNTPRFFFLSCFALLATLSAFLSGCVGPGSLRSSASPTGDTATALDPNYPFSEIEEVYDIVLDAMTEGYFKDYPDLDRQHTAAMREFIAKAYPRERFVELMVREEYRPILERGRNDPAFRETKEFDDAMTVTINVSVKMAKMIVGGQMDVYVARFVDKDPLRTELFEIAENDDQRQFISWVSEEVELADPKAVLGKDYELQPGDRVFAFCSPDETWNDLCGRSGFLIVREGKIVEVVVTMMN